MLCKVYWANMKGALVHQRFQHDAVKREKYVRSSSQTSKTSLPISQSIRLNEVQGCKSFFSATGTVDSSKIGLQRRTTFISTSSNIRTPEFRTLSKTSTIADLVYTEEDSEGTDNLLQSLATTLQHKRWENLTSVLLQRTSWSRLADFAKALSKLPEDVGVVCKRWERELGVALDDATRLSYYREFMRTALGATVMRIEEVRIGAERGFAYPWFLFASREVISNPRGYKAEIQPNPQHDGCELFDKGINPIRTHIRYNIYIYIYIYIIR